MQLRICTLPPFPRHQLLWHHINTTFNVTPEIAGTGARRNIEVDDTEMATHRQDYDPVTSRILHVHVSSTSKLKSRARRSKQDLLEYSCYSDILQRQDRNIWQWIHWIHATESMLITPFIRKSDCKSLGTLILTLPRTSLLVGVVQMGKAYTKLQVGLVCTVLFY